jgi:hypothetical protein
MRRASFIFACRIAELRLRRTLTGCKCHFANSALRKPSALLARISLILSAAVFFFIPISILSHGLFRFPHETANNILAVGSFLAAGGIVLGALSLCFVNAPRKLAVFGVIASIIFLILFPSFMCA